MSPHEPYVEMLQDEHVEARPAHVTHAVATPRVRGCMPPRGAARISYASVDARGRMGDERSPY